MTTKDRAYEAAGRIMFAQVVPGAEFDAVPENVRKEAIECAKKIVDTFLWSMGQEVR